MATRRKPDSDPPPRRRAVKTLEGRENQMIAQVIDLVEKQVRDGTASSQVLSHYLKLGSSNERLQQQKLHYENELLKVKRDAIESAERRDEVYKNALKAMRSYTGQEPEPEDFDD